MDAGELGANIRRMEAEVQAKYQDIRIVAGGSEPVLRGSFPVEHEGQTIERFLIEIVYSEGVRELPSIREIGGRIPHLQDRHVNAVTGEICTDVPELILLAGKTSLVDYLDGPVRNSFISQLVFEKTGKWPFDQWGHGKKGLVEAYGRLVGVSDEGQIKRYLDYVSRKHVKGHWPCPCGGGAKLRDCHLEHVATLRKRIPRKIAARALDRLIKTP